MQKESLDSGSRLRFTELPRAEMITRLAPAREERIFLLLSIFIGVISGLLVVSFRMAIEWLSVLLLGSSPNRHQPRLIIVPAAAGIVIALLTRYVFPNVRGSGINQTKAALYINNGYISFRTVIGKFLLSALAIGSGFSLGPEDPSLQIGAGVASLISRRVGMSKEKLRIFAPIGAAAGLAAAFNAPISAILFVIEEVIGQWSAAVLGSIVLAAVSSVVVARAFWGSQPMFRIPAVTLRDPRWRVLLADLLEGAQLLAHEAAQPAAVVATDPTCACRPAGWWHRLLWLHAGDGRGLRGDGPGDALAVRLADASAAGVVEDRRDHTVFFERNSGRHVRAYAVYRSDAWRGGRIVREALLPASYRVDRIVRTGWHGGAVRGVSPRAAYVGVHGAGGKRQLFDCAAGDSGEYDCLSDLAFDSAGTHS
jgi:hypothetical protein